MSRLHSLRASVGEVASFLHADAGEQFALPGDVTEGGQGLVMFEGGGPRRLRMLRWGFPRKVRDVRRQGMEADIIGLVADLTNPMTGALKNSSSHNGLESSCRGVEMGRTSHNRLGIRGLLLSKKGANHEADVGVTRVGHDALRLRVVAKRAAI